MHPETILLHNYLIVSAMLFGIGVVGFASRRNMIVMFLAAEMMLQGVSLALVAFGRFHNDFGGQMLVVFIIAVAACEAAIALTLILLLARRSGKLDIAVWHGLRESDQPAYYDEDQDEEPSEGEDRWPRLAPAGVEPKTPAEDTDYRPSV